MPKSDNLTVAVPQIKHEDVTPRVRIRLPEPMEAESGVKVDPYEHVTINGEITYIKRGEYVDVTVPVYMILKDRYPNI